MKIRIVLEVKRHWNLSEEEVFELPILGYTENENIFKDSNLLQINSEYYSLNCLATYKERNEKVLFVDREENIDNERTETEYEHEPICPYCGSIIQDAFEFSDEEIHTCNCGAKLLIEREVTIEYNTILKNKPHIVEIKE